jgi:hypothetical protein
VVVVVVVLVKQVQIHRLMQVPLLVQLVETG